MATTEEMNRDIAVYMGAKIERVLKTFIEDVWVNRYRFPSVNVATTRLTYHKSWDKLLPVWKKLRGELESLGMSAMTNGRAVDIHFAIVAVDIESAHSLIHSAIVFLNNNKK